MALPEKPITRVEHYLSRIAGQSGQIPDMPFTRIEHYLDYIAKNGGGGGTIDSVPTEGSTNAVSSGGVYMALQNIEPSETVNVSGTTPTITAESNTRYICGEVTSLSFTPSATGICSVVFTSGSTVTVLTLPQTVMMPEWFEVEANHTYEISIADGVYGAVMVW